MKILSWAGCPEYKHTIDGIVWIGSRSYDVGSAPLVSGCFYPNARIFIESGLNLSGSFELHYMGSGETVPMFLAGEIRQWPAEWVIAEAMYANAAEAAAPPTPFLQTVQGQRALAAALAVYAARAAKGGEEWAIEWQPGRFWRVVPVGPGNEANVQPWVVSQYSDRPQTSAEMPPRLFRPVTAP
jgi:hypothetical protein